MDDAVVGQPSEDASVVGHPFRGAEQGDAPPPSIAPVTVPLRSRRRARALVVQKIQHVIPASTLFFVGMQGLQEGAHGAELALAIVQLVTSAALVISFLRQVRAVRSAHAPAHEHPGVDWFEIFSAGVLFAEALERWHLKHHIARPTILLALTTAGLGLFHGRLAARAARHRVLRVDDRGVRVGGRFWRTFDAPWPTISAIAITERIAEIRTRDDRTRRLHLDDLYDSTRVRAALLAARHHLGTLPAAAPKLT